MSRNLRNRERPASAMKRLRGIRARGLWVAAVCGTIGCRQAMDDQPSVKRYEVAAFFAEGASARPQVSGTIARGQTPQHAGDVGGKRDGNYVTTNPRPITAALLVHGQELFQINCQQCHGPAGYGDGLVVQRGFPQPPSYHQDRLRDAPDGRIFEQITFGNGRMPAFQNLIGPQDRWALVAYVRALQLSQHAPAAELSAADRDALQSSTARESR